MQKLLRNPHTTNGYSQYGERKAWIQSAIDAKANKFAILEKLASNLATKWFTCNTLIDQNYFLIPYGIFLKVCSYPSVSGLANLPLIVFWPNRH
jgi:hypothetical protein